MKKVASALFATLIALVFALPAGAATDKIPTQGGKAVAAAPAAVTDKVAAKADAKKAKKAKTKKSATGAKAEPKAKKQG